jgi:hypothetical protein
MIAALVLPSFLPSCGLLPASHYSPSTLPFPVEQGWVQLPVARWLVNPGIEPDVMLFCPPESCAQQVFVARMELTGREAGFADLLIADPARALGLARPTHPKPRNRAVVKRSDVTPLTLGGWAGASVILAARQDGAKVAHVAVVARREGSRALAMMAVAPTQESALAKLRQALE